MAGVELVDNKATGCYRVLQGVASATASANNDCANIDINVKLKLELRVKGRPWRAHQHFFLAIYFQH